MSFVAKCASYFSPTSPQCLEREELSDDLFTAFALLHLWRHPLLDLLLDLVFKILQEQAREDSHHHEVAQVDQEDEVSGGDSLLYAAFPLGDSDPLVHLLVPVFAHDHNEHGDGSLLKVIEVGPVTLPNQLVVARSCDRLIELIGALEQDSSIVLYNGLVGEKLSANESKELHDEVKEDDEVDC